MPTSRSRHVETLPLGMDRIRADARANGQQVALCIAADRCENGAQTEGYYRACGLATAPARSVSQVAGSYISPLRATLEQRPVRSLSPNASVSQ